MAVLRQNIAFALGIKAVFLVLALAGQATLWMAVFADVGASLLVAAVQRNRSAAVQDIDVGTVQQRLVEQGVEIHATNPDAASIKLDDEGCAGYVVSGAGNASINGCYKPQGRLFGAPRYVKDEFSALFKYCGVGCPFSTELWRLGRLVPDRAGAGSGAGGQAQHGLR